LNDLLGDKLTPGGLVQYRTYHLGHHKFAQQSEDPDLGLSAPFPITRLSLRLTGKFVAKRWRFFAGAAITIAVTAPFGVWWAWFALWWLPQATWYPMI